MTRFLIVALLAACEKKPPPPAPTVGSAPADALVVLPIVIDAAVDVTAEWPTALEITEYETEKALGTGTYYRFRSRPPELGKAMNAWIKEYEAAAKSKAYDVAHCSFSTASRIAVIGVCKTMGTTPPMGHGGAPAGETPHYFAWWMQPGLPAVTVEQLAPDVDVKALLANKGCTDHCEWAPHGFLLDAEGITFEPIEACDECAQPKIPIDELRPRHPWGKKLVDWIRERNEAGETVVRYVKKP